jgi:hypothetical protein
MRTTACLLKLLLLLTIPALSQPAMDGMTGFQPDGKAVIKLFVHPGT